MLNITDIRVKKLEAGNLKAVVSIVLNDCFVIHDIKVIEGSSGLFIAMPSKKLKDGSYKDIVHPINSDARSFIKEKVFEEYNKEIIIED